MQVVQPHERAPEALRGATCALGNLDGVHLGHQAVIAAARAALPGRRLAAAVFQPHPRAVFQPDAAPFLLQSPGQRARALAALGVEALFEIGFDPAMASRTDAAFCAEDLGARLGLAHVAVGADFRFGRGRMGDVASLSAHGRALGFGVSAVEDVIGPDGARVSSTAIRALLAEGAVARAAGLLTRPFAIEGMVITGAQRGRTIGFPTANVALGGYARPAYGVYAVRVDLGDGPLRAGVANLGVKPTVGGAPEPLLETHLFDFEGDLYGRRVEVALEAFLRPERKFESFDALKAQIAADAGEARARLA